MAFESNAEHGQAVLAALSESERLGRKILVEYGGDWCKWSRRMEAALGSPTLSALINEKFIFLRCYVGPDGSWDSSSIELPPMSSVPYFSLVSSDGRVIANQATERFELLWFYRKKSILQFLRRWSEL